MRPKTQLNGLSGTQTTGTPLRRVGLICCHCEMLAIGTPHGWLTIDA